MSSRRDLIIGSAIIAGLFLLTFLMMLMSGKNDDEGLSISTRGEKVAVVELVGPIYDSRRIVDEFKHFSKNSSVKAIVFRIDSPGGGVAASQEIYETVRRIRDSGIPVIASMGTVAASGGYYVACGADTIMANPGTTTGSIGVILEFVDISELLNRIGIRFEVAKSGPYKDTGSPHREITFEERRYLQGYIDDAYNQFVDMVAAERKLERKEILKLADGRIYTGRQALQNHLVDMLGDYEDAVRLAAEMGGIRGEPAVVRIRRRQATLYDLIFQQMEGLLRGIGMSLKYTIQ